MSFFQHLSLSEQFFQFFFLVKKKKLHSLSGKEEGDKSLQSTVVMKKLSTFLVSAPFWAFWHIGPFCSCSCSSSQDQFLLKYFQTGLWRWPLCCHSEKEGQNLGCNFVSQKTHSSNKGLKLKSDHTNVTFLVINLNLICIAFRINQC